jgi:hypothetical protein
VINLSVDGFMTATDLPLEVGQCVYLKLAGLEAQKSRVVWVEDGKAGLQFTSPLHPSELDQIVSADRKTPPKNHFGPRRY